MESFTIFENILLNHHTILIMNNPFTVHFIKNYDSVLYFPQKSTNTCVSVAVFYALSYLNSSIKYQHPLFDLTPFDLHLLITKYKYNKPDLNAKISFIDCLYFLHNYNNLTDKPILTNKPIITNKPTEPYTHLNLIYGHNVFSVQLDWDSIRYYLLKNYPLICLCNIGSSNYHTMVIFGFNNQNKTLSVPISTNQPTNAESTIQPTNAESTNAESTNQPTNAESTNAESTNQPTNAESTNAESTNAETTNTEPINSQPINTNMVDIEFDIFLKLVSSIFVIKSFK
jgi:hypothetical protein